MEHSLTKNTMEEGRTALLSGDDATKRGDLDESARQYTVALNAFRSPKMMLGEAHARRGLATVMCGRTEYELAMDECRRAYSVYEECLDSVLKQSLKERIKVSINLEAKEGMAHVLMLRSEILLKMKRDEEAADAMSAAKRIFDELGAEKTPASYFIQAGRSKMRRGEMKDAERHIRSALNLFKEAEDRVGEVSTLLQMSELHRNQLKLHKAEEALNLARSISQRLEDDYLTACVWAALGGLHLQAMRVEKARAAYLRALPIFEKAQETERLGLVLLGLGEVQSRDDDPKALQTFLEGVGRLQESSSVSGGMAGLLRIAEHGLRIARPEMALFAAEWCRRHARVMEDIHVQGQAMRLVVKGLAALRESRGTLVAALARELVSGSLQQNAKDVAAYYRKRAPGSIVAELEALSETEMLLHLERLVTRVLEPTLATIGVTMSDTLEWSQVLFVLDAVSDLGPASIESDDHADNGAQSDEESDDPPTDRTKQERPHLNVDESEVIPPVKQARNNRMVEES